MALIRDTGTQLALVASAARTATGNATPVTGLASADTLRVQLNVSAAGGTTPTLDVVVEDTLDNGATWNVIGTFAQKVAAGREVINITTPFTDQIRVRWTLAGTTPSFTFDVNAFVQ